MHKLYGIAFQRVLKFFNKDKITFENINELMKEKNIQPTHQIIFHRLPRQDCKDFVKTPCPISNAEETKSEIVQISKRLRSQFKALQSKVCNRCPFKDQCQKKYLEPTMVSENTTRDLLLFMSKMAEYQKTDFATYKTWNGGYKIADSVISMLQDLSQGGKILQQYQKLRNMQVQKSELIKNDIKQFEKQSQTAIKEAKIKKVPLKQSHVRISTSSFQEISMGKLDKFTKKIDEENDEDNDFKNKKNKKRNKAQQVEFQEDDEGQIDFENEGKSFKKKSFQNKDKQYNKFDSQKGGYSRENKWQKTRSQGYQNKSQGYQNKRQGYNKNNGDYNKGYENRDRPQRTWQNRDNQRGEERGAYKSNFNNQRQYGEKRQSYGDKNNRKFDNNGQRGYGQKRNYQNNDRQYNSNRTDRPQRSYNNDRYGQRQNEQRGQKTYEKNQRDKPTRGRNNFEENQYNDPSIRRISKSPINPYEKKGDFSLNDLQKKQSSKPFEQKFNIKETEYTKYERIPNELRTPQSPKKQSTPSQSTSESEPKTERKGRKVKTPTIITQ